MKAKTVLIMGVISILIGGVGTGFATKAAIKRSESLVWAEEKLSSMRQGQAEIRALEENPLSADETPGSRAANLYEKRELLAVHTELLKTDVSFANRHRDQMLLWGGVGGSVMLFGLALLVFGLVKRRRERPA